MSRCLVFHNGVLEGDYDTWQNPTKVPKGAYSYWADAQRKGRWYFMQPGNPTPINQSDVPKELRLQLVLLGVS